VAATARRARSSNVPATRAYRSASAMLSFIPPIYTSICPVKAVCLMAFSSIAVGADAGGVLFNFLGPRTELWIIAARLALGTGMVSLTEIQRA